MVIAMVGWVLGLASSCRTMVLFCSVLMCPAVWCGVVLLEDTQE